MPVIHDVQFPAVSTRPARRDFVLVDEFVEHDAVRETLIVPAWSAPNGVRAVFTTRLGGVSAAPWDSMNLGTHVTDDRLKVNANRERLSRYLQRRGAPHALFLDQVHGTDVVDATPAVPQGACADASLTTRAGQACVIMVADCLPVLFASVDGQAVAAAHAGWRGLAGQGAATGDGAAAGVLESTVTAMRQHVGDTPIVAWLGPCIGPAAFEVGDDVRLAFGEEAAACFRVGPSSDKYLADLPALARLRLARVGVVDVAGNDGSPVWCTHSRADLFFSHRRDAAVLGSTGRMAACVWIDGIAR